MGKNSEKTGEMSMALNALREKTREIAEEVQEEIRKAGTILELPKIKEIVDGWASSNPNPNNTTDPLKKGGNIK